ncbi:MAG: DEAD/DEAH box helicase [Planctomycetota bacterium]|jgi:superfamily II DNA or RNA helicase|nr:DEAD/DEAH box helicase [Planctomycetota bacterium]
MEKTLKASTPGGDPLARYNALSVPDQSVFQALSILYEPAAAVVVTAVLNGAGLRESPIRAFTPQNVLVRLRRLVKAGLVEVAGEAAVKDAPRLWRARPKEAELALRHAFRDGNFVILARAALSAARGRDWRDEGAGESARRNLRLAFHGGDWESARKECVRLSGSPGDGGGFLSDLISAQPDDLWLRRGRPEALALLMEAALADIFAGMLDPAVLLRTAAKMPVGSAGVLLWRARIDCFRGKDAPPADGLFAEARERARLLFAFRSGDDALAAQCVRQALGEQRRRLGNRDAVLEGIEGVAQALAAVRSGSRDDLDQTAKTLLSPSVNNHAFAGALQAARHAALYLLGQTVPAKSLPALAEELPGGRHPLTRLSHALASHWIDPVRLKAIYPETRELALRAGETGWRWFESQFARLAAKVIPGHVPDASWPLLADAFPGQEEWRRSLVAIEKLARGEPAEESEKRIAWLVGSGDWGGGRAEAFTVQPVEQTRGKTGTWSKGRNISLSKIFHRPEAFPHAGIGDRLAFSALRSDGHGAGFSFEPGLVLEALVGHQHVFRDDDGGARIDVVRGEFELSALDRDGGCEITLEPPLSDFRPDDGNASDDDLPPVLARFESPTRLRVYMLDERSRELAMVVGQALTVPAAGREEALRALGSLAGRVRVHSDLPELENGGVRLDADPRPRFHLMPRHPGLKVELWAHPLGDDGPAYRPGRGGRILSSENESGAVTAIRCLDREKDLAAEAVLSCPSLAEHSEGDLSWRMDDPEACLGFLAEAEALGDRVVLAWPKGGRFRVRRLRGANNLSLRIAGGADWLEIDGALRMDENLVVGMADLLAAVKRSSGRFVEIAEGEYVALTEELSRQLRDLESLSRRQDGGLVVSSLAGAVLEEFADLGADMRADRAWRETLAKRKALADFAPAPPGGFLADLRDYQLGGYQWLARLAEWGAGACLADDMGLGKTVQALALLTRRADLGPALVVAPTSVCHNWTSETRRFAPDLRPLGFGDGDRRKTLEKLKPGDLFITSYGLLQQEERLFSDVLWATAVLDEAQAIKNTAAKRSKAAMSLKADFRLITTGTPIENHLGELWNLFRFINPHLLGSWRHFQERFANPIERGADSAARERLQRIIRPFVLRRLKRQVLDALPPKTEITLQVELGQKERAFYEALRREALERLDNAGGGAEQQRMQVLAEIMRLRRACCSPELVAGDQALPSAKQEQFDGTLRELLENDHKALVFSQFVSHLAIIRRRLDARGVRYQYLDGSTPAKRRKEAVSAFQNGDGDVFLISLKAGGLGLNLTAADYVIHMDPWWNPAVEDQASDRAHRIGQTRPVTVYRLVAADTIEERIVDLHRRKRELAEDLLSGSDQSARLDMDEMLRLLREG